MTKSLSVFDSNLFVKKIILDRDKIDNFENYPFNIEIIKNFDELEFDTPVTFGSSLNTNGTPMRIIKDTTLLDMYIKVGIMDDLVTQ